MTATSIVVRDYTLVYLLQRSSTGVIVANRSDGHCASDTLKPDLNNCLGCALEYEFWQYYGDSMSKAGTACGLKANPVEVASAVAGTLPLLGNTTGLFSTKAEATESLNARSPSQSAPSP